MKAKIFYIEEEQEHLKDNISFCLKNVYKYIEITLCPINKNYNKNSDYDSHKNAESFIRLLRKSVITFNDFSIVIKKKNENTWFYMGYEHSNNQSLFTKYLDLYNDNLPSIFPSVALLDRMILLPMGISDFFTKEKFRDPKFDYLFKPFELQGVRLVNFDNRIELESQFLSIGKSVKNEIKQYYSRYIHQISVPNPNLGKLFDLLGITRNYFEDNFKDFATVNLSFDVKIISSSLKRNLKSEVIIKISANNYMLQGMNISLKIKGPNGSIDNSKTHPILFDNNSNCEVKFEIMPKTIPYCPLELTFNFLEPIPGYNNFPIPLILDITQ